MNGGRRGDLDLKMVLKNPATFIKTAKYLPCAGNKCS
jgi:hypothetical protein